MAGFLGAGTVYLDRFDSDGNSTGYVNIGNVPKFAIKEEAELKERVGRQKENYGQTLDSVVIKKPARLSMESDELNTRNLAIALMGSEGSLAYAADSVASEAVTAKLGKLVRLSKREVSNVVVKDETDTTTYVAGTDYNVNSVMGLLEVISGGNISDGDTIHVSFDYAAMDAAKILGGANPRIRCSILLDGINYADDSKVHVEIRDCVLSPSAELNFISDDYSSAAFEGTLNVPDGYTTGYEVLKY